MEIKRIKIPKSDEAAIGAIPRCEVAIVDAEEGGIKKVIAFVRIVDKFDCAHALGSIRMSKEEALDLGARIIERASRL